MSNLALAIFADVGVTLIVILIRLRLLKKNNFQNFLDFFQFFILLKNEAPSIEGPIIWSSHET